LGHYPSAEDVWQDLSEQAALTTQQSHNMYQAKLEKNELMGDVEAAKKVCCGMKIRMHRIQSFFGKI